MLRFAELKTYLDEFAKAVKEGKYNRLPYSTWKVLIYHGNSPGWVEFPSFTFSVQETPDLQCTLHLDIDDMAIDLSNTSFGLFLYNKAKGDLVNQMSHLITTNPNVYTYNTNNTNDLIDWSSIATTTTAIGTNYFTYDNQPIKKEKEKKDMNLIKGFDFGSCENDNIKVSLYGVAVKNATGAWVSYDKESNSIIDVDILNFDAKYLYKMPVAIKDVAIGDCIIHNKVPVYVTEVNDKNIVAIDPRAGEEKTILLTHSMFGFDFVTKVINLFDNFMNTATADAPFGNLLPLMMLSEGNDDMLPLMMMANPQMNMDMNNPLLLYLMTKDGNTSNIIPYFYLMSQKK